MGVTDWIGGMGGVPVWAKEQTHADHSSMAPAATLESERMRYILNRLPLARRRRFRESRGPFFKPNLSAIGHVSDHMVRARHDQQFDQIAGRPCGPLKRSIIRRRLARYG